MVPAWAASSLMYSIERCSFWKRISASISAFGGSSPAEIVPAIWRRSADAALFGEVALLAVAELPDQRLEARRVELTVQPLEVGIAVDRCA